MSAPSLIIWVWEDRLNPNKDRFLWRGKPSPPEPTSVASIDRPIELESGDTMLPNAYVFFGKAGG